MHVIDQNISNLYLLCIHGDEHKLGQVFRNLLSNALKFTPPNGTVCLTVESLNSVEEGAANISNNQMWLTVSVMDTGPGISQVL
jgi:signal transduction histidine kinase